MTSRSSRGERVGGRDQHVEQAVVLEAGLSVGVADGVVQPGGQLERQLALDAGDQEGGQLPARWGTRPASCRRCGTSPACQPPLGATRSSDSPDVARVDLEEPVTDGQPPNVRADGARRRGRAGACGRLDGHQRDAIVGGRGAGPSAVTAGPASTTRDDRQVLVGRQGLAQLVEAGHRAEERARRCGVRRAPVPGVAGNRLAPSGRCPAGTGPRHRRGRRTGGGGATRLPGRDLPRPEPGALRLATAWPTAAGAFRDAVLPPARRYSAQAAHPVPPARRQPLRRGADGCRRVLVRRVVALSPQPADGDRLQRDLRRIRPGRAAEPPAQATALQDAQAGRCRPTRSSGGSTCSANADVRMSYVVAELPSPLYRNAIGDECVYVESGAARRRDRVRRARRRRPATTS